MLTRSPKKTAVQSDQKIVNLITEAEDEASKRSLTSMGLTNLLDSHPEALQCATWPIKLDQWFCLVGNIVTRSMRVRSLDLICLQIIEFLSVSIVNTG